MYPVQFSRYSSSGIFFDKNKILWCITIPAAIVYDRHVRGGPVMITRAPLSWNWGVAPHSNIFDFIVEFLWSIFASSLGLSLELRCTVSYLVVVYSPAQQFFKGARWFTKNIFKKVPKPPLEHIDPPCRRRENVLRDLDLSPRSPLVRRHCQITKGASRSKY